MRALPALTESAALGTALLETGANGGPFKVWEIFIDVGQNDTGTNPTPNFNTPRPGSRRPRGSASARM